LSGERTRLRVLFSAPRRKSPEKVRDRDGAIASTRDACAPRRNLMHDLHTTAGAMHAMQVLSSALLAILFLQSGIDKIVDRRGNLEWLKGHFAKSPLAGMVPVMVTIITILEMAAGALSAIGCVLILIRQDSTLAFYGALVSALSLLALFFGQRMAKDYPGAATLVPYFLLSLAAIYLLAV
jgi:hypothetical protein